MIRFKKSIILFWTLWWFIALWTDVVGALAHLNWLKKSWAVDANYPFLVKSLKLYSPPDWLPAILYAGIIAWLLFITVLFIYTCLSLNQSYTIWLKRAERAFFVSLALWMAFLIGDQLTMQYETEQNHMVQAGFQWLTFLSLYWLPEATEK